MLRRTLVVAIAVAAFAATASAGNENDVIASASGGYGFSTSSLDVGPFTWNAQLYADGSVDGGYNYTQASTSTGARTSSTYVIGRDHRGELARLADRAQHVVPGARQRRRRKRSARCVDDDRRGWSRHRATVLRRSSASALPAPR